MLWRRHEVVRASENSARIASTRRMKSPLAHRICNEASNSNLCDFNFGAAWPTIMRNNANRSSEVQLGPANHLSDVITNRNHSTKGERTMKRFLQVSMPGLCCFLVAKEAEQSVAIGLRA